MNWENQSEAECASGMDAALAAEKTQLPPVRSEPLLAELCGILSAALARGIDAEHPECRVLIELPMTEADYLRLRTIVEANSPLVTAGNNPDH